MFVNVTSAQFEVVHQLMALEGTHKEQEARDQLIRQLTLASAENGGDFSPVLARAGVETELRVVHGFQPTL